MQRRLKGKIMDLLQQKQKKQTKGVTRKYNLVFKISCLILPYNRLYLCYHKKAMKKL